jgi:hypothetical protein
MVRKKCLVNIYVSPFSNTKIQNNKEEKDWGELIPTSPGIRGAPPKTPSIIE